MAAAARFRLLGAGAALIVIGRHRAFASVHARLCRTSLRLGRDAAILPGGVQHRQRAHRHAAERARPALRADRAPAPPRRARQPLQVAASGPCQPRSAQSPLSAIIGFSSMLESGTLPAERAPEFAAIIAHNGELLQRLHDDLLDLQPRRGRRPVHPVASGGGGQHPAGLRQRHPAGRHPGRQGCADRAGGGRRWRCRPIRCGWRRSSTT